MADGSVEVLQVTQEGKATAADERRSVTALPSAQALRLQDQLRVKASELDVACKEITALKSQLAAKDRALSQGELEIRILKERTTATEGEVANMAKELAALKVDKRKTESQLNGLLRKGDKEQAAPVLVAQEKAATSGSGPKTHAVGDAGGASVDDLGAPVTASGGASAAPLPTSVAMATLQSDLRTARMDCEKATENVRGLENVLRAKDKHMNALQKKADEADGLRNKCLEFENKLLEAQKQLEELRAAGKTSQDVIRGQGSEKARVTAELDKTKDVLEASQEAAARTGAALKAAEARCLALESEVGVLVGQLARTTAVANRVAVAETKAGPRDEGTVHVTRHLEEVRFMAGEVERLQERIAALEKELAVSHDLKEQYKRISQQGTSILTSPTSPNPPFLSGRPNSRPSSAQRRPISAFPGGGGNAAPAFGSSLAAGSPAPAASRPASRPSSAPRNAVRASISSLPTSANANAAGSSTPTSRPSSAPRNAVRASTSSLPTSANANVDGSSASTSRPSSAPRNAVRASTSSIPTAPAGAATAPGGIVGTTPTVRTSFSGAVRRSPRPQPWDAGAPSPTKGLTTPAAAAGGVAPAAGGATPVATGAARPSTPSRGARFPAPTAAASTPAKLAAAAATTPAKQATAAPAVKAAASPVTKGATPAVKAATGRKVAAVAAVFSGEAKKFDASTETAGAVVPGAGAAVQVEKAETGGVMTPAEAVASTASVAAEAAADKLTEKVEAASGAEETAVDMATGNVEEASEVTASDAVEAVEAVVEEPQAPAS